MTTLEPNSSALVMLARQASGKDPSDNDVRSWQFPNPKVARVAMKAAIDAIARIYKNQVKIGRRLSLQQ